MTENDVKKYACRMTWKAYNILKQVHDEEFALEAVKLSPYFKEKGLFQPVDVRAIIHGKTQNINP